MMMMLRAGEMSNMKLARRVGLTAASSRDGIYSKRICSYTGWSTLVHRLPRYCVLLFTGVV